MRVTIARSSRPLTRIRARSRCVKSVMDVSTICERLNRSVKSPRPPVSPPAEARIAVSGRGRYWGIHAFHLASLSVSHFAAASSADMFWLVM